MSTLKADTVQSTSGGAVTLTSQSAAKLVASCTLGGALNDASSLNVSSLADGGTGINTLNATNAFSALKAAVPNISNHDDSYNRDGSIRDASTSAFETKMYVSSSGSLSDDDTDHAVVIHGVLS